MTSPAETFLEDFKATFQFKASVNSLGMSAIGAATFTLARTSKGPLILKRLVGNLQKKNLSKAVQTTLLAFSNLTGTISHDKVRDGMHPFLSAVEGDEERIYGAFGVLVLPFGRYLFYIKDRQHIGSIASKNVWKITKVKVIKYYGDELLTVEEEMLETEITRGILSLIREQRFYYAEGFDLSRTYYANQPRMFFNVYQKELDFGSEAYTWNHFLLQPLMKPNYFDFGIPVINGFVGCRSFNEDGLECQMSLVSRISCRNAGPRYLKRGIDKQGFAAMFAESELILENQSGAATFLQTRGSVPMFWRQELKELNRCPDIQICGDESPENSFEATKAHFQNYIQMYNEPAVVLSLLNRFGQEEDLCSTFEETANKFNEHSGNIVFFQHDMNDTSNTAPLDEKLETINNTCGFYVFDLASKNAPYKVLKKQTAVCRTNCLDCIDRTNIAQLLSAQFVIIPMLNELNFSVARGSDNEAAVSNAHEALWLENGHCLSQYYTGYDSVIEFFINPRNQLTSFMGKKLNGLVRLYHNAFCDNSKQESIQYLLGTHPIYSNTDKGKLPNSQNELDKLSNSSFFYVWLLLALKRRWAPDSTVTEGEVGFCLVLTAIFYVCLKFAGIHLSILNTPWRLVHHSVSRRKLF